MSYFIDSVKTEHDPFVTFILSISSDGVSYLILCIEYLFTQ